MASKDVSSKYTQFARSQIWDSWSLSGAVTTIAGDTAYARMMARRLRLVSRYSRDLRMSDEEQPFLGIESSHGKKYIRALKSERRWCYIPYRIARIIFITLATLATLLLFFLYLKTSRGGISPSAPGCDSVDEGYQCQPEISHHWGQYSPYFKAPSSISPETPAECEITFAQVLSRHGGRDPTLAKSILYAKLINKIKTRAQKFDGDFAFLANYTYSLGADQLTAFGEQQMVMSGIHFFDRYAKIAAQSAPFIRASSEQRVIESAQKFGLGYHQAKIAAGNSEDGQYPYNIVAISEQPGSNNTLNHGLCTAFETSDTGHIAQSKFASAFIPSIKTYLNEGLSGANLTDEETLFLMDLCPFETVADSTGRPSSFCVLFTRDEWRQYDYYQTLGKYYGYGSGNPLGPTQGVGFVNEIIARLTGNTVDDHTSSNTTLDKDPATFPLRRVIYADFGHDNDMTAVLAALDVYNITQPLSTSHPMTIEAMNGYSAAWTVPFAARIYFEKLQCDGTKEEMIRVLVNGRVLPLESCAGDSLGRCTLSKFIDSLSFARTGGHWDQCFTKQESLQLNGE